MRYGRLGRYGKFAFADQGGAGVGVGGVCGGRAGQRGHHSNHHTPTLSMAKEETAEESRGRWGDAHTETPATPSTDGD